jgi:hypothetical protein
VFFSLYVCRPRLWIAALVNTAQILVDTVRRQLRLRASEIEEALETNDAVTAAIHPAKDAWVECELCQKLRNVSKATFMKYVDSSFRCALDIDRPEIFRCCEIQDDWERYECSLLVDQMGQNFDPCASVQGSSS